MNLQMSSVCVCEEGRVGPMFFHFDAPKSASNAGGWQDIVESLCKDPVRVCSWIRPKGFHTESQAVSDCVWGGYAQMLFATSWSDSRLWQLSPESITALSRSQISESFTETCYWYQLFSLEKARSTSTDQSGVAWPFDVQMAANCFYNDAFSVYV